MVPADRWILSFCSSDLSTCFLYVPGNIPGNGRIIQLHQRLEDHSLLLQSGMDKWQYQQHGDQVQGTFFSFVPRDPMPFSSKTVCETFVLRFNINPSSGVSFQKPLSTCRLKKAVHCTKFHWLCLLMVAPLSSYNESLRESHLSHQISLPIVKT